MARYQCCSCELVETLNFEPDACSSCGRGRMVDLDAAELEAKRAAEIAAQNDRFRKDGPTDAIRGRVMFTPGVLAFDVAAIMAAVRAFDTFTEENDPWGQHDFGTFEIRHGGETVKLYWKIDLYEPEYHYGSDEPHDPAVTCRVLTVLLPSEY